MKNYLPSRQFEQDQRHQTLTRTIWIVAASTILFGFFNLNLADWKSAFAMFAATGVCLIGLYVCHRGHFSIAAMLICASVLLTISYSIFEGDGLFDPGIVGYPLYILLGTLLLSKKYTPWLTLSAILSIGMVAVIQSNGLIHVTVRNDDPSNFIPITLFLVTGALIVWVILDNQDKNLKRVIWSENELRESYALTIQGWAKALELRDSETAEHSRRVVDQCIRLAHQMGTPLTEMDQIWYGATLHDIGKLGIPNQILHKAGPLSAEEWEVMRKHPGMAKNMLEGIPYLREALDIPYCHHEQWDGSGYPRGLKETQIPLSARIFSVVDVWDAVTSDRPYRKAWTAMQARQHILEQSGKQFDPEVVKAFLEILPTTDDAEPIPGASGVTAPS